MLVFVPKSCVCHSSEVLVAWPAYAGQGVPASLGSVTSLVPSKGWGGTTSGKYIYPFTHNATRTRSSLQVLEKHKPAVVRITPPWHIQTINTGAPAVQFHPEPLLHYQWKPVSHWLGRTYRFFVLASWARLQRILTCFVSYPLKSIEMSTSCSAGLRNRVFFQRGRCHSSPGISAIFLRRGQED